jgi:hemoglobin-like flavoprotein
MDIQQSVGKILHDDEILAELFYARFFERYPEGRAYFADVSLRHQAVLLTMTLKLVEQYHVHRYPSVRSYLRILGDRHRGRIGIPPGLFSPFGDCLLFALREYHGSEWDQALGDQWRAAIDEAIGVMLED